MPERVWRKGTLLHCRQECTLIQPLWKTVWRFLKKLGIKLPYDPAIPLLEINPEGWDGEGGGSGVQDGGHMYTHG